jgi:hypothetical protein
MVAVNDIVVPISLTSLEGGSLEFECSLPGTGLGGGLVLGKRKLAGVVVPRPEKMDGLAAGGSAEREWELNGGHCFWWLKMQFSGKFGFVNLNEQEELVLGVYSDVE